MSEKIHYEDNLFFLHMEIKTLLNGLKLSIDKEYFASSIMHRIYETDRLLNLHYKLLKDNPFLIRRNEFLHTLQKLKVQFSHLIEEAAEKKEFFPDGEQKNFPDLKRKMAAHLEDIQDIRKDIHDNLEDDPETSLSSREYSLLMQAVDE